MVKVFAITLNDTSYSVEFRSEFDFTLTDDKQNVVESSELSQQEQEEVARYYPLNTP